MAPENGTILNLQTSAPWRAHAFLPAFLLQSQKSTAESADPSRRFVREDAPGSTLSRRPRRVPGSDPMPQCPGMGGGIFGGVCRFRDAKWRESVAIGSEAFVAAAKEELVFKAKGRQVIGVSESHDLRKSPAPCRGILGMMIFKYQPGSLVRPADPRSIQPLITTSESCE